MEYINDNVSRQTTTLLRLLDSNVYREKQSWSSTRSMRCECMRIYINSIRNHRITRGRGLAQEGSLRAENNEKDESNAAFEVFVSRDRVIVFESVQHRKANSFKRARF